MQYFCNWGEPCESHLVVTVIFSLSIYICDPLREKVYISVQKLKIDLMASKESAKLALSNDAIVALVAASVFVP